MVRGTDAVKLGVATNTNEQVMAEYIVESVMATDTTVLERVIKTAKWRVVEPDKTAKGVGSETILQETAAITVARLVKEWFRFETVVSVYLRGLG